MWQKVIESCKCLTDQSIPALTPLWRKSVWSRFPFPFLSMFALLQFVTEIPWLSLASDFCCSALMIGYTHSCPKDVCFVSLSEKKKILHNLVYRMIQNIDTRRHIWLRNVVVAICWPGRELHRLDPFLSNAFAFYCRCSEVSKRKTWPCGGGGRSAFHTAV